MVVDKNITEEVRSLIKDGKINDAITVLSRLETSRFLSPEFVDMLTSYRLLPDTVVIAISRNDFSNLSDRDLRKTISFVKTTRAKHKKSNFLSTSMIISLANLEKDLQAILEGEDVV